MVMPFRSCCSQPCLSVGSPGPLSVNWSQKELKSEDASDCQVRQNQILGLLHKTRYLELFNHVRWFHGLARGRYLRFIGRNKIIFDEVLFARFWLVTFILWFSLFGSGFGVWIFYEAHQVILLWIWLLSHRLRHTGRTPDSCLALLSFDSYGLSTWSIS